MMKKIVTIVIVAGVLTSCYDAFRTDYEYTTVAFSTAQGSASEEGVLGRTVVKGEGLHLDFGVYLAGVIENEEARWVEYELDPSLLNGTSYEMMFDDYYTLSNDNRFIIPPGEHIGTVTITLDSTKFVNDPKAVDPVYALPFRLTGTSEDSILATQATKILVVKYMSQHAGFYNQTGTFTTFDGGGTQINSGTIENVIEVTTVMLDTLETNGLINQIGADFHMMLALDEDNSVSTAYIPNPNPPVPTNIALDATPTTSFVSSWESLEAVNDGITPGPPQYGNWNEGNSWQWVHYEFTNRYSINKIDVWWFDDNGGVRPPTDSYVEYWDEASQALVEVPNSEVPNQSGVFNTLTFNPSVVTDQLRLNMIVDASAYASNPAGTGIVEWQAWGVFAPSTPEQAEIASVGIAGDGGTYDPSTHTLSLNYRVDYVNDNYTIVETKLTWRNRIRDGVNEWRR